MLANDNLGKDRNNESDFSEICLEAIACCLLYKTSIQFYYAVSIISVIIILKTGYNLSTYIFFYINLS